MVRILVVPERLYELSRQMSQAANDLRSLDGHLGRVLGGMDWQVRQQANIEGQVQAARSQARALAERAEAMARYLSHKARLFGDADQQGAKAIPASPLPSLPWPIIRPPRLPWPFPQIPVIPLPVIPPWWKLPRLPIPIPIPSPKPPPTPAPQPKPKPTPTPAPRTPAPAGDTFKDPTRGNLKKSPYYHYGDTYQNGSYKGKPHPGIDVKGEQGDSIYPIGPGKVFRVGYDSAGYGHYVVIEHTLPDGRKIYSLYAHLQDSPDLRENDLVTGDTVIGRMGLSGSAEETHLHLEIRTEAGVHPWRTYKDLKEPNWKNYWLDPEEVLENPNWRAKI